MACTYGYHLPLAVLKLVFTSIFISQLIGWRNVLIGFLIIALMLPISSVMSKKYGAIQFGLMKYRDERAKVLSEILRGIRQIRIHSLEDFWKNKLIRARDKEMDEQWYSGVAMSSLVTAVNAGSSLLETLPVSIFMLKTGSLSASTAFTCLELFTSLQDSMSRLPLTWTYLLEAWTSCQRLEAFLR